MKSPYFPPDLMAPAPCFYCKEFPCSCRREEARPCACGGVVIANPTDPTYGVRDHQQEPRHKAWARGRFA